MNAVIAVLFIFLVLAEVALICIAGLDLLEDWRQEKDR